MLAVASDPNQPLLTAAQPLAVQLGLIDSNDTVDLVALSASGLLTVALNAGNDHWQSSSTIDLALGPMAGMKLSHVDRDLFSDLVLQGPNSVSVALGNGSGQFTLHDTFPSASPGTLAPSGGGGVQMDTSLLNGDLLTDVVTVAPGSDQVLLLLGKADGGLSAPAYYGSGAHQPVAVVVGDFVGDVAPDLAVGHTDGSVTFLQGRGDGTFQLRSDSTVTRLGTIAGLAAADLDSDGDTDLVVSGTDQVNLLLNDDDPLPRSPIVNGDFSAGLTGWQAEVVGHGPAATPGSVSALGGFAQLRENQSFLVSLQQTFIVPPAPQSLSLDIVSLGLDEPAGGLPDALEISLLDDRLNSLVPTFRGDATSLFNVSPPSAPLSAPGVTFDGTTVTVDISGLTAGIEAMLYVDLVGNPPGQSSVAGIDNVRMVPDTIHADSFSVRALDGPFAGAAGIALGQVDGDAQLDIVVADRAAGTLLVFNGDASGDYVRSQLDLAGRGNGPLAVAAQALTAGDHVDDVVIAMFDSSLVLTPLGADTTGINTPPEMLTLIPPSGAEGQTLQLSASYTDPGYLDAHRATVDWGDGQTSEATVSFSAGQGTLQADHVYSDDRLYTVTVVVTDSSGLAGQATATAAILNVAPTVYAGADQTVRAGDLVMLSGSFTDPGTADTHTYLWQVSADNGQTIPGGTSADFSFVPDGFGTHIVTLEITDDDGGVGTDVVTVTVEQVVPASLVLASVDDQGALTLHLGPRAADRGEGQTDGDETLLVQHVAGQAGDETVSVTFAGQTQTFEGVARIAGDGGQGHDTIEMGPGVLSSAILSGGPGDDRLVGGAGNDVLVGGTGANYYSGGLGDDKYGLLPGTHDVIIDADPHVSGLNAGFDTLYFCHSASRITIDLDHAAPLDDAGHPDIEAGIQTVDAAGSKVTLVGQIENFVGSQFSDHVILKPLPGTPRVVQGGGHQPGSVGDRLELNSRQLPAGVEVVDTGLSLEAEGYGPVRYSQFATGVAIPNAVLFQGVSPPVAGSTATLLLPADPAVGRQFRWISDDSVLHSIDTALASATVWKVVGSNPQRLILRAAAQGITLQASITFAPANQAVVDVVKAGAGRVRYLLQLVESTAAACDGLFLPQPINAAPSVDPLGNLVVDTGQSVSLAATFSDPGDPGQHRATVQWGDGSTSPGVIAFQDGHGTVTAQHVYAGSGSYPVTVQVIDHRGATGVGTALITVELPRGAKLFVVDQSAHQMFRYDAQVHLLGQSALASAAPRGAATDPLGQTLWVISASSQATVDVYQPDGTARGSWQAPDVNQGVGIASDGVDVWVVDEAKDRVHFYQDAAQHLSGKHSADSTFGLDKQNKKPSGLTTSGTTLWVTDEKKNDPRVFVYDVQGTTLGQWSLDPRNSDPSGIALDVSRGDLWVVDRHDGAVYLYSDSIDQRQGSRAADAVFALDAANHNPEGIADPIEFISIGDVASGSLDLPFQMDEWLFSATAGQYVGFDVQLFLETGDWTLTSPSGTEIFSQGMVSDLGPIELFESGLYTLSVSDSSFFFLGGPYQFQLHDVLPASVQPIDVGDDTVSGEITAAQEFGVYTFDGTAGDRVFFDAQQGGQFELNWWLTGPTGKMLFGSPYFTDQGTLVLPDTGQYKLVVGGDAGTAYGFQLVPVAQPEIQPLALGAILQADIWLRGEEDVYTFEIASAGQRVFFDAQQGSSSNLHWTLTDPHGTRRFGTSFSDQGALTLDVIGSYTLVVDGVEDWTGTYGLQLVSVAEPVTRAITIGDVVDDQIAVRGEEDIFTFQAVAGQEVQFDAQLGSSSQLDWWLTDPSGANLFGFSSSYRDQGPLVLETTGPYTLRVSGDADWTGSYRFELLKVGLPRFADIFS